MRDGGNAQSGIMKGDEFTKDEQRVLFWWRRLNEKDQKLVQMLMELLIQPKKGK